MIYEVPKKRIYLILNLLGLVCWLLLALYLALGWQELPDQIVRHYNFRGEADAWGGKGYFWFMPAMMLVLYILLTVIEHFPRIWNTGVPLTENNYEIVLGTLKLMIILLKLSFIPVCAWTAFCDVNQRNLGAGFLPFLAAVTLGPLIICSIRIYRAPR